MEELDLKELISMFLERKLLIILIVIVFALVGAIYTLRFITPIYKSTTSVILTQTVNKSSSSEEAAITQSDLQLNSNLVDDYKKIASSKTTTKRVIENLGLDLSVEDVATNTVISTSSENEVIEITVSNVSPELACAIANETANVLIERAIEYYKVDNANILDEAEVALKPSNVNLFKNIVIFAFVGGVLVSGYILLVNMLDTTIKTDTDIMRITNLPVLASIVLNEDTQKKKKSRNSSSSKRSRGSSSSSSFSSSSMNSSPISSNTDSVSKGESRFTFDSLTDIEDPADEEYSEASRSRNAPRNVSRSRSRTTRSKSSESSEKNYSNRKDEEE